jgi:hypothetical protein
MSLLAEVQMRRPRPSAMASPSGPNTKKCGGRSPVHATPHAAALHCSIVTCWEINAALRSHWFPAIQFRLTRSGVF